MARSSPTVKLLVLAGALAAGHAHAEVCNQEDANTNNDYLITQGNAAILDECAAADTVTHELKLFKCTDECIDAYLSATSGPLAVCELNGFDWFTVYLEAWDACTDEEFKDSGSAIHEIPSEGEGGSEVEVSDTTLTQSASTSGSEAAPSTTEEASSATAAPLTTAGTESSASSSPGSTSASTAAPESESASASGSGNSASSLTMCSSTIAAVAAVALAAL